MRKERDTLNEENKMQKKLYNTISVLQNNDQLKSFVKRIMYMIPYNYMNMMKGSEEYELGGFMGYLEGRWRRVDL